MEGGKDKEECRGKNARGAACGRASERARHVAADTAADRDIASRLNG